MRKKCLIMPMLLFSFFVFFSGKSMSQVKFGLRGGYDLVNHNINTDILNYNNRVGYHVGFILEAMSPVTGLGADISVLYGRQEYSVSQMNNDPTKLNYDYISIPINIKKRISILSLVGVFAVAGVYAESRIQNSNIDTAIGNFEAEKFAAGLNAGFGVQVLRKFDLGMYYRYQLTQNFSTDVPQLSDLSKNNFRAWSLGLTYFF